MGAPRRAVKERKTEASSEDEEEEGEDEDDEVEVGNHSKEVETEEVHVEENVTEHVNDVEEETESASQKKPLSLKEGKAIISRSLPRDVEIPVITIDTETVNEQPKELPVSKPKVVTETVLTPVTPTIDKTADCNCWKKPLVDQIVITDVTVDDVTISFKESYTPTGFFCDLPK